MSNECNTHKNHNHQHGANCGHIAVKHGDHIDYLHDGHLHNVHEDHVDEHVIDISEANPDRTMHAKACGCSPECECSCIGVDCGCDCSIESHKAGHIHNSDCGHEAVPHGDHVDYLVNGRLHFQHGDCCHDHGPLEAVN